MSTQYENNSNGCCPHNQNSLLPQIVESQHESSSKNSLKSNVKESCLISNLPNGHHSYYISPSANSISKELGLDSMGPSFLDKESKNYQDTIDFVQKFKETKEQNKSLKSYVKQSEDIINKKNLEIEELKRALEASESKEARVRELETLNNDIMIDQKLTRETLQCLEEKHVEFLKSYEHQKKSSDKEIKLIKEEKESQIKSQESTSTMKTQNLEKLIEKLQIKAKHYHGLLRGNSEKYNSICQELKDIERED